MKNLSSLTTFFVTLLFVIYLGVFTGLKVNGFIAGKQLVTVLPSPQASIIVQPTPSIALAQAPQKKTQVQGTASKSVSAPAPTSAAAPTTAPAATATSPPVQASPPAVDTSTPTLAPVDTSTPPPAPPPPTPVPSVPPPSARCIITISGGQYDVTDFRNIHSGGNVFQCGTDMTAVFLSRHPASYLSKMSQYKV